MIEQFNHFGKFFDYEFIEAIDGKELKNYPPQMNTANKYACLLSHRKALLEFANTNYDFALILEDDVVFSSKLVKELNRAYKNLPFDWDMLYLSYFPMPININPNLTKHYQENLYRMNGQLGAFAYIVRKSILEEVLFNFLQPNHYTDNKLAYIQKLRQCYAIEPFLCYVKEDYSDLSGQVVNYTQIKERFLQ